MQVQSRSNILTYSDLQAPAGSMSGGKVFPSVDSEPAIKRDRVTLSSTAKALSDSDGALAPQRTEAQQRLIMGASSDSASAEKIAHDMAVADSMILYDISELVRQGVLEGEVKLSTSGRVVGEAFKEAFAKEAAELDAERLALYRSEKAKGTDALQILKIMIDFTNENASDLYKEATGQGWFGK